MIGYFSLTALKTVTFAVLEISIFNIGYCFANV